jgi:c-di-GMP-binding flagellar brake protein YcgR
MSTSVISGKTPENLLFRSRLEICRILQLLAQEQSPLTARLDGGQAFASHFLSVDPCNGHFAVAYGAHKESNAALLESASVEFTATDRHGLHFSFAASDLEEVRHDGQPAIRFTLPKALLLHNQREHARIPVPADMSLRCVADEAGVIPFESHITDISHDGLGCLIYDPDINLDTGALLRGCRIVLPDGDAVIADLEVMHIATITLADGRTAHRAGLRFVQGRDGIAKLIRLFIQDLGKP